MNASSIRRLAGHWVLPCVAGWGFVVLPQAAYSAQEGQSIASPITDRFALSAGWYHASLSTEGRVDDTSTTPTTPGTPFSAEDDFGLADTSEQLRVEIMFRLRERNRLRVDMFDMKRTGTATLIVPYEYGGTQFQVGDVIRSRMDWLQMGFTYTYSALRTERVELGVGLGVHAIQAEARADRTTPAAHEKFTGAGPFPTIAVDGTWCISRRFSFNARGNYLKLTVNNITGKLADYRADLQFRWRPNLAFGIGYELQDVELDLPKENPSGMMRMRLSGPLAFVRASF